jgi:hypothetical protein
LFFFFLFFSEKRCGVNVCVYSVTRYLFFMYEYKYNMNICTALGGDLPYDINGCREMTRFDVTPIPPPPSTIFIIYMMNVFIYLFLSRFHLYLLLFCSFLVLFCLITNLCVLFFFFFSLFFRSVITS